MAGLPDRAKLSKPSVRYRPAELPGIRCGTCVMFHPATRTCDLVAGDISPGAVCDRWEPQETSGNSREAVAATAGAAVAAVFAAAEAAILAALAWHVAKAAAGTLLVGVGLRRLRQAASAVLALAGQQARGAIAAAGKQAAADAERVIREDLAHLPGSLIHRAVAEALSKPAAQEWRNLPLLLRQAGLNALREADDAYRRITADVMRQVTSAGTELPGISRLQAAQKALDEFAARGIAGFTDSRGRNWDLTSYVEMATRTAASRMHLGLQLGAMGPAGFDLVIVDNPSMLPPCAFCRPFEGKVLSLTGTTPPGTEVSATSADGRTHTAKVKASLAEARAAGLFHPNCRHSLLPFTDGAGFLPLAGGDERGYIEHGRSISHPLPIGTLAGYEAEQKLRAFERAVRREKRLLEVARTTQAKGRARRRVAEAERHLREHARRIGVAPNPRRTKLGVAR